MSIKKRTNKSKLAKLTVNDTTYDFPIYESTDGESVIDISTLHSKANIFTYDPGFTSTASCESKITYIDGEKGILRYRGYDIEELDPITEELEEKIYHELNIKCFYYSSILDLRRKCQNLLVKRK